MKSKTPENQAKTLSPFEQVYEIVKMIPPGKVYTYGLVSNRMNKRLSAAAVGWAMNALGNAKEGNKYSSSTVPWHRVINSKGKLSTQIETGMISADGRPVNRQRLLLEQEGVRFRDDGSIDMTKYLWSDD